MATRVKKEWFEDEAFWVEMYPFMFSKRRFTDASEEMEKTIKLTGLKGKTVLDLCCGPGRCSIALAKNGFKVTGVDRTRSLLNKARAKARYAKMKIEWIEQDMRDFVRPEAFDFVLSMFTSFGYFDDKREDMAVLRNMFTSLKPSGACLIDLIGKEWLAAKFQPTTSTELPDGTMVVQRHKVFDGWTRMRNEWILIRKGRAKRFHFHHTIYSGQELRDRLEQTGFREVKLYGNLDGDAYGRGAKRLIAVGRKPAGRQSKSGT